MKPLINLLQDETDTVNCIGTKITKILNITKFQLIIIFFLYICVIDNCETDLKIVENQMVSIEIDSEIGTTNDSSHWLDSMLDDSDE